MGNIRRTVLVVMFSAGLAAQMPAPQRADRPFDPKEYPAGKFQVTKNDFPFGELTVRVIDVKNLGYTTPPNYCSAWVEIRRGEHLVKRISYLDIEPVGFSFGAFVSKQQPDGLFAVVKEGDYDGRLLLINPKGEVVDLPGGFYFVTADRRYLISEYASDDSEPAFTVFDLEKHRVVLQPKDTPELGSWYHDASGYFVVEYGRPGHAERLDLENQRVLKISISSNDRKNATKVAYDFDPRKKQDCVATAQ